jgi:hypothetical protein
VRCGWVLDHRAEYPSQYAVAKAVAGGLDIILPCASYGRQDWWSCGRRWDDGHGARGPAEATGRRPNRAVRESAAHDLQVLGRLLEINRSVRTGLLRLLTRSGLCGMSCARAAVEQPVVAHPRRAFRCPDGGPGSERDVEPDGQVEGGVEGPDVLSDRRNL